MAVSWGCRGKVKYRTYTDAKKKVRAMKYSDHIDRSSQSLNFYRCPSCKFYHIGNNNKLDKIRRNHYKRSKYDERINISSDRD